MIIIGMLVSVLWWSGVAEAATYWVATTGSDSAGICASISGTTDPGTYGTFHRAKLCATSAGDIINFKAGTYTNAAMFKIDVSADGGAGLASGTSEANRTIVQGAPGEARPLMRLGRTGFVYMDSGAAATRRSYLTIRNFTVDGTGEDDTGGCTMFVEGAHIIVEDIELYNSYNAGICSFNFQSLDDPNNHHLTFRRTKIHSIAGGGGAAGDGAGVCIYSHATNTTIEYSECYDVKYGAYQVFNAFSAVRADNAIIHHNYIHDIKNQTQAGSNCFIISSDGLNDLFHHNIIVPGSTGNACSEAMQAGSSGSLKAYHNLITGHGTGIYFFSNNANSDAKNNLLAGNGAGLGGNVPGTQSNNKTTGALTDCTVSSTDLSHKSTSTCINAGINISGFAANGLPDIGPFEVIPTPTAAVASGNTVDVTLPMTLNTPVQPATGQTTWMVKFNGLPRITTSAVRLSNTSVRIQFNGTPCTGTSDNITVDLNAPVNVTDAALIGWLLNQKVFSFTGLAVNESNCSGTPPPLPDTTPPAAPTGVFVTKMGG